MSDIHETAFVNSIGGILAMLSKGGSKSTPLTDGVGSNLGPTGHDPLSDIGRNMEPNNPDQHGKPFAPLTGPATQSGGNTGDEANPVQSGPESIAQGYGGEGGHPGVDIGVPVGTTLVAAIGGTVTVASNADPHGYGNYVEITGANGISVRYGHLSYIGAKVGQQVRAGQPIGKSGGIKDAEGSGNSKGPHLHFEVRQGGHSIDPMHFLAIKGNGLVAGTPGELAPTVEAPTRTVTTQDAADTAMARLTGVLSGKGDPGSENALAPEQNINGVGASNADTSKLQGMDKYFGEVLKGIGAPITATNLSFMRALMRSEGGSTDNPFNVTENAPGASTINSHGVKRYADQATGIASTIKLMLNGLYPGLINALRNGSDANAIIQGFATSPWVGGGSGGEADLIRRIMNGG